MEDYESVVTTIFQSGIFKWIFWILLVSVVIWLVKKMWDSGSLKRKKNESFEEEKEFLIGGKRKGDNERKREGQRGIPFFLGQRTNNDRVRTYYQKLLRFCQRKAVQLLGSDTSLDVNRKCRFDEKTMDSIRSTYIKARYSGQEVEKAELDEFVRNYKQISNK